MMMAASRYRHSATYRRLLGCTEWRRVRAQQLQAHPFCQRCQEQGITEPATEVHHLREVESGHSLQEMRDLCYASANLQSLCRHCHHEVHRQRASHSRQAHHQREADRLQQWIDRHRGGG